MVEDEIITFLVNEEEGQDFNYDTFDVSNSLAMDECISYSCEQANTLNL